MQKIRVEEAVNCVLCHDITKIVPGEYKGRAFQKGHVICPEDIPELLSLGKDHIYVWECHQGQVHENEAAQRLAAAAGRRGVTCTEPYEGKVNLVASYHGLLKVEAATLAKINSIDQVVLATLHNNQVVTEGQVVAGTRVIPLVIEESKILQAEKICSQENGIVEVKPFRTWRVGLVVTGNEVYYGRIKDLFGEAIHRKLEPFNSKVFRKIIVPDEAEQITRAVNELLDEGAELIILTGGMSVDPDDVTPTAIRMAGASIVSYGAPVLPGSMFMMAYLDYTPIMGLPGCVMYSKTTIFDLILPRILAGEKIGRADLVGLGYGGLCLGCQECHFPACSFGKSI